MLFHYLSCGIAAAHDEITGAMHLSCERAALEARQQQRAEREQRSAVVMRLSSRCFHDGLLVRCCRHRAGSRRHTRRRLAF
jgi:hypothetical protein